METGKMILEGNAQGLIENAQVLSAYLGS